MLDMEERKRYWVLTNKEEEFKGFDLLHDAVVYYEELFEKYKDCPEDYPEIYDNKKYEDITRHFFKRYK